MARRPFRPKIAYFEVSRTFEDSHFSLLIFQDQFDFNAFELVLNLKEKAYANRTFYGLAQLRKFYISRK